MKKIGVIICGLIFVFSVEGSAQLKNIGLGVLLAENASHNFDDFTYYSNSFGMDLRTSLDLTKKIKLVPAIGAFLPAKEDYVDGYSRTTLTFVEVNAHYLFSPKKKFCPYVLVGASGFGWIVKDDHTSTVQPTGIRDIHEFSLSYGANLGGGFSLELNELLKFYTELKYPVGPSGQIIFEVGAYYTFK